jgi:hypothetical protein
LLTLAALGVLTSLPARAPAHAQSPAIDVARIARDSTAAEPARLKGNQLFDALIAEAARLDSMSLSSDASSIVASTTWIRKRWDGKTPVPDGYWSSLAYDLATLRRLNPARAQGDTTVARTLSAVADDLRRKKDHCQAMNNGLGGLIDVTVIAWRNQQKEDRTWEVRYMPALMKYDPKPRYRTFNGFATSTEKLAPGDYVVWLVRAGTPTSAGPTVERSASGAATTTWDVTVP